MMINESRRSRAHFDLPLVLLVFGLAAFGVLAVSVATFSTSSAEEDTLLNYIVASYYGLRQSIFFLISPVIIGVITYFPYEFIRRRSSLFYFVACGLLLITLVSNQAQGVKAWTDLIWGYTIQPSEFVKLACIIVVAKYLESNTDPMGDLKGTAAADPADGDPLGPDAFAGRDGLRAGHDLRLRRDDVLRRHPHPHTGGHSWRRASSRLALLYGVTMASGTDNYRLTRILSFINPELVDESATYQVTQSKIAIGSGGLKGVGMFVQGSFSQLDYVPEDWTDFIFSTIGEAWGFVGCAAVVIVYLLIILRMMYLARYTADRFGQMVILGVMAMLLFHVFENVGMTTGLMPVTGIPLPFLSYGGSNLVTNMAGIGLVLNVVKNRSITSMPGLAPQTRIRGKYTK